MTLERVHGAAEPADPRAGAAPFRPSYDVMWARPRPALREMRAPAWVDDDGLVIALYYNDEIATLVDGERGTFSAADGAGLAVARSRDAIAARALGRGDVGGAPRVRRRTARRPPARSAG